MLDIYEPHSLVGLLGLLVIVLGTTAVAVLPSYLSQRRHNKALNEKVTAVQQQVVNGHKVPLRSDLDRVLEAMESIGMKVDNLHEQVGTQTNDITGLRQDITGLRNELRDERGDRILLERRVQDFARRAYPDAGPV